MCCISQRTGCSTAWCLLGDPGSTSSISSRPRVPIKNTDMKLIGIPTLAKSKEVKYDMCPSSLILKVLTFGKELKGMAMAAEIAIAAPITTISGQPKVKPILQIIGNNMIAATVWLMKVAVINTKNRICNMANHGWSTGNTCMKVPAILTSSPDESMALPKTLPPPTSISVDQEREEKSTSDSIPDPKTTLKKSNAIIPISPKMFCVSALSNTIAVVAVTRDAEGG